MNLTSKEKAALQAIFRNDFTFFNGGLPPEGYAFQSDDFQVWFDCISDVSPFNLSEPEWLAKGRALGAAISSLVQKGLVSKPDRETVVLTEEGYKAVVASYSQEGG